MTSQTTAPTNEMLALADEYAAKAKLKWPDPSDVRKYVLIENALRLAADPSEREALERIIKCYERNVGRQSEKLDDIPRIARSALSNLDAAAPAAGGDEVARLTDERDRFRAGWNEEVKLRQNLQIELNALKTSGNPAAWLVECVIGGVRNVRAFPDKLSAEMHFGAMEECHYRDVKITPLYAAPPLQAPAHSDAVREAAISFLSSFRFTVCEKSFYKDAYLNITRPDKSCCYRLSSDSTASEDIAGIERKRAEILAALTAPAAKAPAVSEADVERKASVTFEKILSYKGHTGVCLRDMIFDYYAGTTDDDNANRLTKEFTDSIYTKFLIGGTEGETAAESYARTGQPLFRTQWEREEYERSIGYVRPSDPPSQEASAPEPVAWRWKFSNQSPWCFRISKPSYAGDADIICQPLYDHPPAGDRP